MLSHEEWLAELRWRKFDSGSSGWICLVDTMGTEADICDAARVSYGKGTKSVSDNETLIRYLIRHGHSSPLEQAELKFLIRCPMDVMRQLVRHRTMSMNEYSTRYSEAIEDMATTLPDEWRLQSSTNKQGSSIYLNPVDAYCLTEAEKEFHIAATNLYQKRLSMGIAREQARKDLPLATYTEAYFKFDLHNLLHFLSKRMESHAQLEIREFATIIGEEIVAPLYPAVWEAFLSYKLNAITMTVDDQIACTTKSVVHIKNKREKEECLTKLGLLGISIIEK